MTIGGSWTTRAAGAVDALHRSAHGEASVHQVLEEVVDRIVSVVPADAFFAGATDPESGLGLGAGIGFGLDEDVCRPYWEHELLSPDFNQFIALTPDRPVGDLREATGGRPLRSPRARLINAIAGLEDEVRVTLPAGRRRWGDLQLSRGTGAEPFTERDHAFLRAVAPVAGGALRRALLRSGTDRAPSVGPGVLVLDAEGTLLSATPEADIWLSRTADGWHSYSTSITVSPVLVLLMSMCRLVRADTPPQSTRLCTGDGQWLTVHASALGDRDQVAMVIEPARPGEIVPLVLEACGLTDRELEVTRLVTRGLSTGEIATRLCLSPHTVRGYVKSVFEKVGASSRGELTARLFAPDDRPWSSTDPSASPPGP